MDDPDNSQTETRQRWQGWLQTLAFLGALAILVVVFYTSSVVQKERKADERKAATGAVEATAAWATGRAEIETGAVETSLSQRTIEAVVLPAQQTVAAAERLARQSTPVAASGEALSPENADRVEALARWGRGILRATAFSPDGRLLAVGTTVGVDLYDWPAQGQPRNFDTGSEVYYLAFSPDGQALAVLLANWTVQIWQLDQGMLLRTVEGLPGQARWLTWSQQGLLLAGRNPADESVWLWQEGVGLLFRLPTQPETDVGSLDFSPSGKVVAVGRRDGTVELRQTADGSLLRTLRANGQVDQLRFSPDGELLAAAFDRGTVQLWRVGDGTLLKTLDQDISGSGVLFSADGQLLLSGGRLALGLWSVPDGLLKQTIELPFGISWYPQPIAFSPDGKAVAVTDPDHGQVHLWQTVTGQSLPSLVGYSDSVLQIGFSPDGQQLIANESWRTIWLWQVANGMPRAVQGGTWDYLPPMLAATFSPDNSMVIGVLSYGTVHYWRLADERVVHAVSLPISGDLSGPVAFSPGGVLLAAGRGDQILTWRAEEGTLLRAFDITGTVASLAFSPDGRFLAAGVGSDVYIWQMEEGILLGQAGGEGFTFSIAWSGDEQYLALARENGVELRRSSDLQLIYVLPFSETVKVALSPDGRLLAAGATDGVVRLCQAGDGTLLRVLEGPTRRVMSMVFSPDGKLLAVAADDGTVWLWGAK